jgi:hypothetical protein
MAITPTVITLTRPTTGSLISLIDYQFVDILHQVITTLLLLQIMDHLTESLLNGTDERSIDPTFIMAPT